MSFIAGETLQPGDIVYLSGKSLLFKQRAEAKMNKATIQALHKSIAHWNDICYGESNNHFADSCALCEVFNPAYSSRDKCSGCPVNAAGRRCQTTTSEWYVYYAALEQAEGFCTVDSADAAEAMLELLVSLLPDTAAGGRYIYNATQSTGGLKGYQEWFTTDEDRLVGEFIGITTDGRNAFPQAKYVWEKVFVKQAPLTATAIKDMWKGYSRKNSIDPWPKSVLTTYEQAMGRTVRDGKCVTCGQVVKKKVTKYKVAYREMISKTSPGYGDVCESSDYYVDKGGWDRAGLFNWEFVGLIKSTAKEFDA